MGVCLRLVLLQMERYGRDGGSGDPSMMDGGLSSYTIHALYVMREELVSGRMMHEKLLLLLMFFADMRGAELSVLRPLHTIPFPLTVFLFS